ncbi:MAG: glycosyltransferase [Vulcanimicrobiaceae bacterium]
MARRIAGRVQGPSTQYPLRILIPAYNESERIVPTLDSYCRRFHDAAIVTVVANGCSDDTIAVVERLMQEHPNLELLAIEGRIGKGGAIRAGLKTGNEKYVGFADADGSTSAQEFERLYNECLVRGSPALMGSRWLPGAVVIPRQPFLRRLASRTFNSVVRLLFRLPYSDTQCGAKLFRRDALSDVLSALEIADFAFDIEVLWNLRRRGIAVVEVPTVWADRAGTKVRLFHSSLVMLRTVLRMRLHQSIFWRVPFLDFFGRSSVIPVKKRLSVLILNARCEAPNAGPLINELQSRGCYVAWAPELAVRSRVARAGRLGEVITKLRCLWWYIFSSQREYDALIEFQSHVPALVPSFSAKRTFLIRDDDLRSSLLSRLMYRALYQRSIRLRREGDAFNIYLPALSVTERMSPEPAVIAERLLQLTGLGTLYHAAFEQSEEGWTLQFEDPRSGTPRLKHLQ